MPIDADDRADLLVAEFSVGRFQMLRALVSKKVTIGISFASMLQSPDGSFAPPRGKPFETKLRIDLKRGISGSPTMVRGDFNADGLTDLVAFSGKPSAMIHLTTPAGVFPSRAALTRRLPRAPADRALMDIEDLDGDGRSDIAYFTPEGTGFVVTVLRSKS
jgi:hypothetical protein